MAKQAESPMPASENDIKAMVQELQVHQIELEMQNEELQHARIEAEEMKDRYLDLYDFAPVGYFIFDIKGTILSANLTAARMLGIERYLLTGRRFQLLIDENSREEFSNAIRKIIESGEGQRFEVTLPRADQAPAIIEIQGVKGQSAHGKEEWCRAAATDITDRKRSQDALRESEEQYRRIVETATEGIWVIDTDTHTLFANRQMTNLLRVSLQELQKRTCRDFMYPEDFPGGQEMMGKALATGTGDSAEFRYRRADGTEMWALVRYTPISNDAGETTGMLGMFTDITERRRSQEELKVADAHLRMAVEATEFGTFDYHPLTGEYIWSEQTKRHFGLPPDAHVDQQVFLERIHPDDREHARQTVQTALLPESGGKYENEYRTVGLDGVERWIQARGQVFFDEHGIAVEIVGGTLDITERKGREQKLREYGNQLNRLLEHSPLPLIQLDSELRVVRWSEEAEKLFGWTSEEAIGQYARDVPRVYEKDRPAVDRFTEAMRTDVGMWNVITNRNYRKDGSILTCEWHNSVLRDASGHMTGILSLVLDIRRTHAEELLRQQLYLLQRALIPLKPPSFEGYSTASAYIPGLVGVDIGGDFLDVFLTENGSIGILIGDVSGKGIEAAALAAITRSTIGAFAYEMSSPGEALSHTNSILALRQTEFEHFVTAFLAVLDPVSGSLRYSSAGHPPGIICRTDNTIELLHSHDMPLGVTGQTEFEQGESCLMPGDRLVIYTDGVSEARSSGAAFFGTEGIVGVLTTCNLHSSEQLIEKILDAVKEWSHGQMRDDTAILIVGRDG